MIPNHLINEDYVFKKPQQLCCIEFIEDETPSIIITSDTNSSNKYEFKIKNYCEYFYKNNTLLELALPFVVKKDGKDNELTDSFIKFLKKWYYTDEKFSIQLTKLRNNLEFNFFKDSISINKNTFFIHGFYDNNPETKISRGIIFRILLNHKLLK